MNRILASFACGLIFGLGLVLSGMANPAKVIAFLDVAGDWDPSLALVMAGAIAVVLPGYKLLQTRPAPLLAKTFNWPGKAELDGRLFGGAALFGMGWGLGGYCPGPAIVALGLVAPGTILFIIAMLAGMIMARWLVSAQVRVTADHP